MPQKLTDADLATLETTAIKELELIDEGQSYVAEITFWRMLKVIGLLMMQIIFYLMALVFFLAFIFFCFYGPSSVWDYYKIMNDSQLTLESILNVEQLITSIKIIRIVLFFTSILFLIAGLYSRQVRKAKQVNNNMQIVLNELKNLVQKRKLKFNV